MTHPSQDGPKNTDYVIRKFWDNLDLLQFTQNEDFFVQGVMTDGHDSNTQVSDIRFVTLKYMCVKVEFMPKEENYLAQTIKRTKEFKNWKANYNTDSQGKKKGK